MVGKEACAWVTEDGYCRWHKEKCCRSNPGGCSACVRPVSQRMHCAMHAYMNNLRFDSSKMGACLHPNAAREHRHGYNVYRTCTRKRRFTDVNSAREKAIYLNRRKGLTLAVYECPFCHGYHLTSQLRDKLALNTIGSKEAA